MKSSIFYAILIIMIGFGSIEAMHNEKTVFFNNKSDLIIIADTEYPPLEPMLPISGTYRKKKQKSIEEKSAEEKKLEETARPLKPGMLNVPFTFMASFGSYPVLKLYRFGENVPFRSYKEQELTNGQVINLTNENVD